MRGLKIAAYVVGALLAVIVIGLLLVVWLVNPNDYRAHLERMVEQRTGRQLSLSGDLKLSIFPWIALETGPASLGEAPGFGTEPFVSIQEARLGVRLLPLLRGQIEAGKVRLVGARVRLMTDEQGRENWADLTRPQAEETPAEKTAGPTRLPTIAGLEIKDAGVTIENAREKTRQVVRDFNLETGALRSGEPFEVTADFVLDRPAQLSVKVHLASTVTADLERNAHQLTKPEIDLILFGQGYPREGVPVEIRASIMQADIGQERYRLDGFTLAMTWKGDGFPAAGVPVSLKAQALDADLAAQTLALTGLAMDVAGAHLTGELRGTRILDAPTIKGPLQLAPIAPREWLPKLGVAVPQTADAAVLQQLSFASNVALTKTSAELGDIVLKLDDTTAKGMLAVADFDSQALRFDLNVDRINADRYLPPAPQGEGPAAKGGEKSPPAQIPVDALRKLNARGDLRVEEAIFAGLKFTMLRLGVNARDGKVRFSPSEAAMYGGQYRGDIGIDATGNTARVSLDEHISGVDFAPLFKDLFQTSRVSGKGSANLEVTGSGRATDELMKTLDGTVDFKVADGALEGADLWYEIRRARAVLKQQPLPERSGPARTPFTALTGSGVMKNGVLSNDDLSIATQYLKLTGKGTVNLPNSTLDYRLLATVLKIPAEGAQAADMQDMVDAQIPVTVTGSLDDPKVRPDLEGYLRGKAKERVDQEKQKLEQKLKDKLKDFLNR
jgi:AsmA protein